MEEFKRVDTKFIMVDPDNPSLEALVDVAEAARAGELIVFPTDTVYGVGTNPLIPAAVLNIFKAKERPSDKPLILMVADPEDIYGYVSGIDSRAERLMRDYWPGALTLIFKKSGDVPPEVTAGGDTVGVRCPNSSVARAIIRLAGMPLATTSANMGGKPSPTNAQEAKENLDGRVSYIVDGGESQLGIESTVLDLSSEEPKVIREGFISWDELKAKLE